MLMELEYTHKCKYYYDKMRGRTIVIVRIGMSHNITNNNNSIIEIRKEWEDDSCDVFKHHSGRISNHECVMLRSTKLQKKHLNPIELT